MPPSPDPRLREALELAVVRSREQEPKRDTRLVGHAVATPRVIADAVLRHRDASHQIDVHLDLDLAGTSKRTRKRKRPAPRGYNPAEHGNGFRYDWTVTTDIGIDALRARREDKKGFRLGYLATCHLPAFEDPHFYALWIKDDDVSFLTGYEVFFNTEANLAKMLKFLREIGARPLAVVYTRHDWGGFICISWIKDRRFAGEDDWRVVSVSTNNIVADYAEHDGYRPIWCTQHAGRITLVLVRDVHGMPWLLKHIPYFEDFPGFNDPVAPLLALQENARLRPICVECKGRPAGLNAASLYERSWLILAVYDPDLDPFDGFIEILDSFLTEEEANLSRDAQQRIEVFAVIPGGGPGVLSPVVSTLGTELRFDVVQTPAPKPQFRSVDDPVDVPLVDGLDELDAVNVAGGIEASIKQYMQVAGCPALTLAIKDAKGWRLRRAYTYAPWVYKDALPETQFRVGSLSKHFTMVGLSHRLETLLGANVALGYNLQIFPFPGAPAAYSPFVGEEGYSELLGVLTIKDALLHTTGFVQNIFDPGASEETLVQAVVAAGLSPGMWSTDDVGLLPLTRHDYLQYMTRGFVGYAPPGAVIPAENALERDMLLALRTGWRAVFVGQTSYSGFDYDWLGLVLEVLSGEISGPDEGWDKYRHYIDTNILGVVGATRTIPGRTVRGLGSIDEATYAAEIYLEMRDPPVVTYPTEQTSQVTWSDSGTVDFAYESFPPEVYWTPRYVTTPYGGKRFYCLEAALAAGGWVSTAPDLCRIQYALESGQPAVLAPTTIAAMFAITSYSRARGFATGSMGSYGSIGLGKGRSIAICASLADLKNEPFNPTDAVETILDIFNV